MSVKKVAPIPKRVNALEVPVGQVYKVKGCCGMAELYGINNGMWSIERHLDLLRKRSRTNGWRLDYGILVVVDRNGRGQGENLPTSVKLKQLRAYVRRHGLGRVTLAMPTVNPNSGNTLHSGIWAVNKQALIDHLKATAPKPKKKPVTFTAPVMTATVIQENLRRA